MNRLYEIFKTPSGPSTVKALLNHTIFSPFQTGETVPLSLLISYLTCMHFEVFIEVIDLVSDCLVT
jgi:hypothetical protein